MRPYSLSFKRYRRSLSPGISLVEIMVAMAILTIGVLAFVGAFGNITKAIHLSRSRTIATSLAQEKIEALKNLSYHRLLVTQSSTTATESGLGGFYYDDTNYPEEDVSVGQISFKRRVLIEKVEESGSNLISRDWWDNDTGLKQIIVYAIWQEGGAWKKIEIRNLRDDPNRQSISSTIIGTVDSSGSPIQDASVVVMQNVSFRDQSDASGDYEIAVPAGTFDVKVSAYGYFSQTKSVTVATDASVTRDFSLTPMGAGTVTGTAFMNNHLVVSQIVGSVVDPVTSFCQEYVEVFNPSTYTWTIASAASSGVIGLGYQHYGDPSVTVVPLTYNTLSLAPSSYYLIANTTTVRVMVGASWVSRNADAYYNSATNVLRVASGGPCVEPANDADLVGIAWIPSVDPIDYLGWRTGGNNPPGFEGAPINQTVGLEYGEQYLRKSNPGGFIAGWGAAYDTNNNNTDFVTQAAIVQGPRNSSDVESIISGTPAAGALVFLDDGLSSSAQADSSGYFSVPGVATGTWTILVSSAGLSYTDETVTIANAATTNIGNIVLNEGIETGFVAGRILDSGSVGIAGILVSVSGAQDYTDAGGSFRVEVDSGTHTIIANPNSANSLYTSERVTGVSVNVGEMVTAADITLMSGGSLEGFVTTNGVDPLPGIPIIATANATSEQIGTYVTDYLGKYYFTGLEVGDYTLTPQLEPGESASPSQVVATVSGGSTVQVATFTIANAFATISGTVSSNSEPIKTGVLLLAVDSSVTVGATPPAINDALRNGTDYYYVASSDADGSYELKVRGGVTYNVYAWYTEIENGSPITTQKADSATVAAAGNATVNFTW